MPTMELRHLRYFVGVAQYLNYSGEGSRARLRLAATRAGVLRKRLVFVVAAPPDARLVTPLGGAVEPLVHAPEAIQSARIGGIGVVDDAVLERERAHARPLATISGCVDSAHGS